MNEELNEDSTNKTKGEENKVNSIQEGKKGSKKEFKRFNKEKKRQLRENKRKNKKKIPLRGKIILSFSAIILGTALGAFYWKIRPSTIELDPLTYFPEFKENQINMTYEDTRIDLEVPAIIKDGEIYISTEFAKKYVDDAIYYDENEKVVTITNPIEIKKMQEDTSTYLLFENDRAYISASYIENHYPFELNLGKDGRLILAYNLEVPKQLAKVRTRNAVLRTHPNSKKPIIETVHSGDILEVYQDGEKAGTDGYVRVRNQNGIIGYVWEPCISMIGETEVKEPVIYGMSTNVLDEKVKLVWDQVSNKYTNWNNYKYNHLDGANVISPTWFDFANADGTLNNRGSKEYVEEAHKRDLEVWALLSNNFAMPEYTKEILSSTSKRQYVIDQIIEYADLYGFDGINIDIENIEAKFSEEWVQFMRELYPQMRKEGLTVSVDIYIPSNWSYFYEREKVGKVVDYFMVMAYDQHWSGSEKAGPVAAIPWVIEGLEKNLEEVPNDKLVLGIPFFNRVWAETDDGLETKAESMYEVVDRIANNDATIVYDPKTKLNYVEYENNNKLYKIWLEDIDAITRRIEIINEYDLAGYAGWRLGLETPDIWVELSNMQE
ncbi:hypothetical protein AN639_08580 [Candidatus Epulonipiscium fishelsonii]|uniref:Uncharacterized protein n=1 Tax=Candidatus Epulonipiscium fishelsonii TaxID=77094 RepID=A0ACC8X9E8_9FIRM|nr:hypothetical protein AN639_08580 [Epulopiscium sp. SCG-B05WGA-EpuloA1]ONI38792.1 hypothetical protein AN396_09920 [Epulopiscium sp. SCG-B11WGA-EpuloA1]